MLVYASLVVWVVCGVLAYGLSFARMEDENPATYKEYELQDQITAIQLGVMGPFGLYIACSMLVGTRRFKWRRESK